MVTKVHGTLDVTLGEVVLLWVGTRQHDESQLQRNLRRNVWRLVAVGM